MIRTPLRPDRAAVRNASRLARRRACALRSCPRTAAVWPGVCNSAALPGFESVHLSDLERIPLDHGVWRPIRRPLAITGFAVNAYSAEAGESVIEPHDETSAGAGGHQELYLVASGAATFTVGGEAVEAATGTLVARARDDPLRPRVTLCPHGAARGGAPAPTNRLPSGSAHARVGCGRQRPRRGP